MNAETITLTITIRPSYANATHVKQEVEDSLLWLSDDHNAITLSWDEDGDGEWPDDEEENDDAWPNPRPGPRPDDAGATCRATGDRRAGRRGIGRSSPAPTAHGAEVDAPCVGSPRQRGVLLRLRVGARPEGKSERRGGTSSGGGAR